MKQQEIEEIKVLLKMIPPPLKKLSKGNLNAIAAQIKWLTRYKQMLEDCLIRPDENVFTELNRQIKMYQDKCK